MSNRDDPMRADLTEIYIDVLNDIEQAVGRMAPRLVRVPAFRPELVRRIASGLAGAHVIALEHLADAVESRPPRRLLERDAAGRLVRAPR